MIFPGAVLVKRDNTKQATSSLLKTGDRNKNLDKFIRAGECHASFITLPNNFPKSLGLAIAIAVGGPISKMIVGNKNIHNENAGALTPPPASCPPCQYS